MLQSFTGEKCYLCSHTSTWKVLSCSHGNQGNLFFFMAVTYIIFLLWFDLIYTYWLYSLHRFMPVNISLFFLLLFYNFEIILNTGWFFVITGFMTLNDLNLRREAVSFVVEAVKLGYCCTVNTRSAFGQDSSPGWQIWLLNKLEKILT